MTLEGITVIIHYTAATLVMIIGVITGILFMRGKVSYRTVLGTVLVILSIILGNSVIR